MALLPQTSCLYGVFLLSLQICHWALLELLWKKNREWWFRHRQVPDLASFPDSHVWPGNEAKPEWGLGIKLLCQCQAFPLHLKFWILWVIETGQGEGLVLLSNCVCLLPAEVYYDLSEEKVCQFYAELLLRPAGKVQLSCQYLSISSTPNTHGLTLLSGP